MKYIKSLHSAMSIGLVKFVPISFYHEPPANIPLLSSKNRFRDEMEAEKLSWFRDRMKVIAGTRVAGVKNAIQYYDTLIPCRDILVKFNDYNGLPMGYRLLKSKIVGKDKNNRGRLLEFEYPDYPPSEDEFKAWVDQSMNESAINLNNELLRDITFAKLLSSNYLTNSKFVADFIKTFFSNDNENKRHNILDLALQLNLPIANSVRFDDLVKLRQEYGFEFHNFRVELGGKLRLLRTIQDPDELKNKLEIVENELEEVQINDIRKSLRTIFSKGTWGMFWTTAGLAASCCGAPGLPIASTLICGLKELTDVYNSYESTVKNAPGFFLWKVQNTKFK